MSSSKKKKSTPCWQKSSVGDVKACEVALVEHQAVALQSMLDETAAKNQSLLRVFVLVRAFLVDRRRVCYGGTAINNLLPKKEQFYGAADIPDYDAYSDAPMQDARDMVDLLRKNGVRDAEARAGVHVGTFKVYADFVAVLDLTELPPDVFQCLQATAVPDARDGLLYAHPMYLRVGMHLELSRPMGDVSRWSKVVQRLVLLDEAFPFQNDVERLEAALRDVHARWPLVAAAAPPTSTSSSSSPTSTNDHLVAAVDVLADEGAVFSGAFACCVYKELDSSSSTTPSSSAPPPPVVIVLGSALQTPCMDVLVHGLGPVGGLLAAALGCGGTTAAQIAKIQEEEESTTTTSKKTTSSWIVAQCDRGAKSSGFRLVLFAPLSDLVSWRLELVAPDGRRMLAVYETNGCHAFNEVTLSRAALGAAFSCCTGGGGGQNAATLHAVLLPRTRKIRVSNMDDAAAFLGHIAFVPRMQRLDALASVRAVLTIFGRHSVDQRAPWARFQLPCLGEQHGLVEMRKEKAATAAALKKRGISAGNPEFDRWFLKYDPGSSSQNKRHKRRRAGGGSKTHRTSKNGGGGRRGASGAGSRRRRPNTTMRRLVRNLLAPS